MIQLLISSIFIGSLTITAYRSTPQQTDSTPYTTSIGERVTTRGCAISQDMLVQNGGPLAYGDLLYIDNVGFRFINDTMNHRCKKAIDLWVPTKEEERKIDKQFKGSKTRIWVIRHV